ncbi:hypothetical protein [Sphingobium bisphenolivorans]|nr:hypothetical protein [Sphingobium bisphenolivorans]
MTKSQLDPQAQIYDQQRDEISRAEVERVRISTPATLQISNVD